jgi:hypothetical protein
LSGFLFCQFQAVEKLRGDGIGEAFYHSRGECNPKREQSKVKCGVRDREATPFFSHPTSNFQRQGEEIGMSVLLHQDVRCWAFDVRCSQRAG